MVGVLLFFGVRFIQATNYEARSALS